MPLLSILCFIAVADAHVCFSEFSSNRCASGILHDAGYSSDVVQWTWRKYAPQLIFHAGSLPHSVCTCGEETMRWNSAWALLLRKPLVHAHLSDQGRNPWMVIRRGVSIYQEEILR
jgi:hypothetical protein